MVHKAYDDQEGYYITHPNGQTDHYYVDSFVDPWLPTAQKPILLIQHGYGRHADFWYHWVPALARKYIVIRRDTRGHGRSSFPKRVNAWSEEHGEYEDYQYDIHTIVGEIVDFLDQLGIEKCHFLGESTSGELGHALAALHPDRVATLITSSSPTYLPADKRQFLAMGHASWPEAVIQIGSRGWAEALAGKGNTSPVDRPQYAEWWLQQVGRNPAEGMAGYADFLCWLNSREFLEKIKCPTLILAPTQSAATPKAESEYAAERIKGSKLVWIDAPAHEIYVERSDECLAELEKFHKALGVV